MFIERFTLNFFWSMDLFFLVCAELSYEDRYICMYMLMMNELLSAESRMMNHALANTARISINQSISQSV